MWIAEEAVYGCGLSVLSTQLCYQPKTVKNNDYDILKRGNSALGITQKKSDSFWEQMGDTRSHQKGEP